MFEIICVDDNLKMLGTDFGIRKVTNIALSSTSLIILNIFYDLKYCIIYDAHFQSHDTWPIDLARFPTTPNSGYFRWPWIWNERKSVQNSNLVNRKSAFFVWFEPLNQKREANKILLRLLILAKTQPKKKSEKCGNLPSAFYHENSRGSYPNYPDTTKKWTLKISDKRKK